MKIVIVNGSPRTGGATAAILRSIEKELRKCGAEIEYYDEHAYGVGCFGLDDYVNSANQMYQNMEYYQYKIDDNGVIRVYDPINNIFGSYNPDGTTRTYFSPSDGQLYFDSQPGVLYEPY